MIQSHLLLLLRVATMRPDDRLISPEGLDFLDQLEPYLPEHSAWAVLGQCLKDEPRGLSVETFAALRLQVRDDNSPWKHIPFFLRTGKQMAKRHASIAVKLKAGDDDWIIARIQPDPGVLRRRNGHVEHILQLDDELIPQYEHSQIFREILTEGRLSHAISQEWAIGAWRIVDEAAKQRNVLLPYQSGSDGPAAASRLMDETGHSWLAQNIVASP